MADADVPIPVQHSTTSPCYKNSERASASQY